MAFARILVAIDGSDCSDRAFATALEQGVEAGVEVEVDVRSGHAAELISQVAAEGAYDLVVLGHRGHFVRDRLLGSTADRVAEHAPCPVMIVR
jgi:nucleotide-binding universal stress UspA family protein